MINHNVHISNVELWFRAAMSMHNPWISMNHKNCVWTIRAKNITLLLNHLHTMVTNTGFKIIKWLISNQYSPTAVTAIIAIFVHSSTNAYTNIIDIHPIFYQVDETPIICVHIHIKSNNHKSIINEPVKILFVFNTFPICVWE